MFLFDGAAAQCTPMMGVLLLYKLPSYMSASSIIQLSPEGEVNSGRNMPTREALRYISSAVHRP